MAPPPLVRELGLPIGPGGRIEVEPTLRVKHHENIWAIGDAAAVPDPAAGRERPTRPRRSTPFARAASWPTTSHPR